MRAAVQWRKIMFGNRSETGEFAVARLSTVTRTCQIRRGRPLFVGPDRAFTTLCEALAVARPFDTVHVLAGTYAEALRVPSGVRIVANKGATLTHPDGVPLVLEGVKNVTIGGLRIMSRTCPARVVGGRNIEFNNCEFIGLNANGPEIHRGTRVTFSGCTLSGGMHAAVVFGSYSMKFLDCSISGQATGILAFHSALRLERSEIQAEGGPALLVVAPSHIWPEIAVNAQANGDMTVEWVEFQIPYQLNLQQVFASNTVPSGMDGLLMAELRSTLARQTRFRGKDFAIAASAPGLVVLESCDCVPDKTGRVSSLTPEPSALDLQHVSYQEYHAAAQAYFAHTKIE